jgi:hypothetical protein
MLKSAYQKSGGYANLLRCEDYFMWRKLAQYGNFYIITDPLIKYRLLSDSLNKTLDDSYVNNVLLVKLDSLSKKNGYTEKDIELINDEIKSHIIEKESEGEIQFSFMGNILLNLFNLITRITSNYKIALYSITFLRNSLTFFKILFSKKK